MFKRALFVMWRCGVSGDQSNLILSPRLTQYNILVGVLDVILVRFPRHSIDRITQKNSYLMRLNPLLLTDASGTDGLFVATNTELGRESAKNVLCMECRTLAIAAPQMVEHENWDRGIDSPMKMS